MIKKKPIFEEFSVLENKVFLEYAEISLSEPGRYRTYPKPEYLIVGGDGGQRKELTNQRAKFLVIMTLMVGFIPPAPSPPSKLSNLPRRSYY